MTVQFEHSGMQVRLPRKGYESYPLLARGVLEMFVNRKARQGNVDKLDITRVTHQDDPAKISIYFTAMSGPLMHLGVYGGPRGDNR